MSLPSLCLFCSYEYFTRDCDPFGPPQNLVGATSQLVHLQRSQHTRTEVCSRTPRTRASVFTRGEALRQSTTDLCALLTHWDDTHDACSVNQPESECHLIRSTGTFWMSPSHTAQTVTPIQLRFIWHRTRSFCDAPVRTTANFSRCQLILL